MTIEFIMKAEDEGKQLVFGDVDEDQLFIDIAGRLCMKVDHSAYNTLTDPSGVLWADDKTNVSPEEPIQRILHDVIGIKY